MMEGATSDDNSAQLIKLKAEIKSLQMENKNLKLKNSAQERTIDEIQTNFQKLKSAFGKRVKLFLLVMVLFLARVFYQMQHQVKSNKHQMLCL